VPCPRPAHRRELPLAHRAQLRWPRPGRRACDEDRRSVSDVERHEQPVHWFESNPIWFKTAVFYEIHTRAFFDGNDDGSGDFRGLQQKLDYLQWLGIDCIWLLPFYPSPLRDGGYDVADYLSVSP